MTPLNSFTIRERILVIIYGIICLVARHLVCMCVCVCVCVCVCLYTHNGINTR